jgi:hypothetical protein
MVCCAISCCRMSVNTGDQTDILDISEKKPRWAGEVGGGCWYQAKVARPVNTCSNPPQRASILNWPSTAGRRTQTPSAFFATIFR